MKRGDFMSKTKRCILVVKFKWCIRPVVIKNVVEWYVSKDNDKINYTTSNGGGALTLKDFVYFKYIT